MRTLGPYQLLRKVGSGGMAEVWSARRLNQVAGEKFVAIKVLARHVAENPRYREMFVGEARLSLLLNHANIISVFDVVESEGECYMVMELVEGMTLSQLVRGLAKRGERLPVDVAVYVIAELLRALAYAHELHTDQGTTIVHRDVSPQNVMVSTAGEVKLMDFGIARFSTEETSGNLVKGKLQYMPPEQLSKRTREPTLDLFAVGGILQEIVEGRRFRGGLDQEVLLGMVFSGEVPELRVELPEALAQVRAQLLDPNPETRLQSAKQALAQIYDWPGYRNASLQLEELVQQFVEPASATAMPIESFEPSESATVVVEELATTIADGGDAGDSGRLLSQRSAPPWIRSRPDPALFQAAAPSGAYPAHRPASHGYEPEVDSEVDIMGDPAGTGGGPQPDYEAELPTGVDRAPPGYGAEPISELHDPRTRRRQGAIGAVLVGLVALLGLVAFQAGLFGDRDDVDGTVAKTAERERIVAPPVELDSASAEAPGEAEPSAARPSLEEALAIEEPERAPGPERAASGDEGDDQEANASEPEPTKKHKAKVSVEFTASDFYFVYVKVAGRSLTLEPNKTVRLPVGSHAVYLRQKPDQSWKKAGSIRLGRGASYKVEMKKPASLRLIKK